MKALLTQVVGHLFIAAFALAAGSAGIIYFRTQALARTSGAPLESYNYLFLIAPALFLALGFYALLLKRKFSQLESTGA